MANIITAADVSIKTGISVNYVDVAQAQAVIEAVLGVDLADDTVFSTNDLRLLRLAVTWQTAYLQNHPEVLTTQTNVKSVSANGAAATFTGEDGLLSPLAARSLARLSWVVGVSPVQTATLYAAREQDWRGPQPDPWVSGDRRMSDLLP